jgi:CheY-like chemotaxis protein
MTKVFLSFFTRSPLILVVDSDPIFLEKAEEILNRDRQVFFASDRKRAFELARDLGFSVALVDLNLRGLWPRTACSAQAPSAGFPRNRRSTRVF